jgi:hypothetical protein
MSKLVWDRKVSTERAPAPARGPRARSPSIRSLSSSRI